MPKEQKIRAYLFDLSVLSFILGLPFILSFALGYQFNWYTLRFTKAGLITIKTQPSGASIYLNDKLLTEKTPATLTELMPNKYYLKLNLEGHYPYSTDVKVDAGKVTHLDKIILFPLRSDVKQLNKERISYFLVDEGKDSIYYVSYDDKIVYKSDLNGEHFEKAADLKDILSGPLKWKNSYDRKKLVYFNNSQIGVVYLELEKEFSLQAASFILDYSDDGINDVFWHADNYHLIIISYKKIEIIEAKPEAIPVTLVNLNKRSASAFYDYRSDILYFQDSQKASDERLYDNIYKLDLSSKISLLQDFRKLKPED